MTGGMPRKAKAALLWSAASLLLPHMVDELPSLILPELGASSAYSAAGADTEGGTASEGNHVRALPLLAEFLFNSWSGTRLRLRSTS
jgi:hypothetical protein